MCNATNSTNKVPGRKHVHRKTNWKRKGSESPKEAKIAIVKACPPITVDII